MAEIEDRKMGGVDKAVAAMAPPLVARRRRIDAARGIPFQRVAHHENPRL